MSISLRILVCLTGMVLIYMARKANIVRKMTERQSIFWILAGIIIILFGLIPQLVYLTSDLFAVEYPPSIIFAIAIILATYGIFNCYQTNAELSARVQELAMQVSLLNEENSHLKKLIDNEHVIIDEIVSEASIRNEAKTAVYNQYDGEGWC